MWRGAYEGALDIFGILVFENFVFCVEMNLWGLCRKFETFSFDFFI